MAETTDLQRLIVSMEANIKGYEKSLNRALGITNARTKTIENRFKRMEAIMSRGFSRISSRAVGALTAALSVREVIAYGDAWTRTGNMLRAAGVEAAALATYQKDLADLAVRSNSPFEDTVKLYSRLVNATREMGVSQSEVAIVVETLNKSFQLNGTTAGEAAGAITQFSQAMSSGVLRGEELNSILEQAPPIARAIAKEFGVSVGELKKLGQEGALNAQRVLQAVLNIAPETDAAFSKMQTTVGQALTNLSTRFTQFIGGLEREIGQSAALAGLINLLADALENLTPEQAASRMDVLNARLNVLGKELTVVDGLIANLMSRNLTIDTDSPAFVEAENRAKALREEIALLKAEMADPNTRVASAFSITDANPLKAYTPPGKRPPPPPGSGSSKENPYAREIRQIQEATKAAEVELALIGQTEFARDKARAALELENAARRAGITLTDEHRGKIDALSTSYAMAAENVRKAEDRFEAINELQREFGQLALDGIMGLIDGTKSLNDVLADTLKRMGELALQAAILGDGPFASLFGGKSSNGGVGGLIGGIGKLFGGFFADGGNLGAGKWGIAGEAGPEIIKGPAQVVPNTALRKMGGGGQPIQIHQSFDFRGADPGMRAYIEGRLAQVKAESIQAAVRAVPAAAGRSPGYYGSGR